MDFGLLFIRNNTTFQKCVNSNQQLVTGKNVPVMLFWTNYLKISFLFLYGCDLNC